MEFQPPCNEQGRLQPDQVAQSPVQPDLECFQDGASTTLLSNLCQGFTTLTEFLPYIEFKPLLF